MFEIARQLDLQPKSVENIIKRAQARCSENPSLDDLMKAVAVQPRPGRPKRERPEGPVAPRAKKAKSKAKVITSERQNPEEPQTNHAFATQEEQLMFALNAERSGQPYYGNTVPMNTTSTAVNLG